MWAKVHDWIIVQNNPVSLIDPYGLWSMWTGWSYVAALPFRGGHNAGFGMAYDSDKKAGLYGTHGSTGGIALSGGVEAGFFTGSIEGKPKVFTIGAGIFSLAFITEEKNWGIAFGLNLGFPFEWTISNNETVFISEECGK